MPFVNVAGVDLFYEEEGEGPAIVFAHESAADCRQWRGQVEALRDRFRCIVYNARGYPPSAVPSDDASYGYEAAWRDLAAVVQATAPSGAHIVGLSMGAYAALMLGLNRPELVRSLVLAGCGTGSTRDGPAPAMQASMEALARLYLEEGSRAGADRIAGAPNRLQLRKRDPAAWHLWYDDLVNHSAEGMALTLRNYQARRPSLYSFETRLARLPRPALLVVGDEDEGCIDVNLFLKRTLPEAGLWISPHTGHAVNLDAPAEFNKEVRSFIEAVEAAVALVS